MLVIAIIGFFVACEFATRIKFPEPTGVGSSDAYFFGMIIFGIIAVPMLLLMMKSHVSIHNQKKISIAVVATEDDDVELSERKGDDEKKEKEELPSSSSSI